MSVRTQEIHFWNLKIWGIFKSFGEFGGFFLDFWILLWIWGFILGIWGSLDLFVNLGGILVFWILLWIWGFFLDLWILLWILWIWGFILGIRGSFCEFGYRAFFTIKNLSGWYRHIFITKNLSIYIFIKKKTFYNSITFNFYYKSPKEY